MKKTLITLCLLCGLAGAAVADETPPQRLISVTGESSVPAAPDMALVTLGVAEQADTAAAAMNATSDGVARILERLTEAGIAPRDMQTSGLSLQPVWSDRYGNSDTPPKITGYEARNTVTARVRQLDSLGALLDDVIQNGANSLDGLSFDVQNPAPLEEQARKLAVKDAMERAQDLAEASGVTLGPVQSISEHVQRGVPKMMDMAAASRESASVPIAGGEVSFAGSVAMVFSIAD